MDTIEDQITKMINKKKESININNLFDLYNQQDIYQLIKLKNKLEKNLKPEYNPNIKKSIHEKKK